MVCALRVFSSPLPSATIHHTSINFLFTAVRKKGTGSIDLGHAGFAEASEIYFAQHDSINQFVSSLMQVRMHVGKKKTTQKTTAKRIFCPNRLLSGSHTYARQPQSSCTPDYQEQALNASQRISDPQGRNNDSVIQSANIWKKIWGLAGQSDLGSQVAQNESWNGLRCECHLTVNVAIPTFCHSQ